MKKIVNIFFIMCIICTMIIIFNFNTSLATVNPNNYDPGDITTSESKLFTDKIGVILGFIRNITAVVAVITLMIIGFKYMIGSVEDKANYKTTMVPYIIGCILSVAGTTIVDFIYKAVH